MARLKKGITGGFTGKIGEIQGKTYNSTNVITKAKGKLKDKTKVSNQPQNERFKVIKYFIDFYGDLLDQLLINEGIKYPDWRQKIWKGKEMTEPYTDEFGTFYLRLPYFPNRERTTQAFYNPQAGGRLNIRWDQDFWNSPNNRQMIVYTKNIQDSGFSSVVAPRVYPNILLLRSFNLGNADPGRLVQINFARDTDNVIKTDIHVNAYFKKSNY